MIGSTPPREISMNATAAATIFVSLVTGLWIATGFPTWTDDPTNEFIEFEFRFLGGDHDPTYHTSARITASPPHWFWAVDRNVYGCHIVVPNVADLEIDMATPGFVGVQTTYYFDDRLGPMVACYFSIPTEWGCADIQLTLRGSYEDQSADPIQTPFGPSFPRIQVIDGPHDANDALVGVCPEPPLPVIAVSEPSFRWSALIAILTVLLFGRLRKSNR